MAVSSALVAGLHAVILSSISVSCSDIFEKYFEKIQEILFWKVFQKIFKSILKNFEKNFGKINKNYKILRNNLMTR